MVRAAETGCSEPLAAGAPDLRGLWQIVEVRVNGEPDPTHSSLGSRQRVEQAGDRIVITSGGVVHDMRCDGTLEHGVDDVAAADFTTRIRVAASYEDGVHVLAPEAMPVEVTRQLEDGRMHWHYGPLFDAVLERIGDPT